MRELTNTELAAQLTSALQCGDSAALTPIFERLALLDGYQIAKRARTVLEALTPEVLETLGDDPLERAHQLTMTLFRASVLSHFEDKPALVDPSIKGDITAWIDANAGAIASANLQWMQDAIAASAADAQTPQTVKPERLLTTFRQLIDPAACEYQQRRILRDIWAGIETAIAELLSADLD